MRFSSIASSLLAAATGTKAVPTKDTPSAVHNLIYFDQYHYKDTKIPARHAAAITHVVMAFANSSLFIGDTTGPYEPFLPVADVRAMFSPNTKVGIALGGWGDTAGFSKGAATEACRAEYAANVAAMAAQHGFDFVDVDWEFPGGNGEDYRRIPNSDKASEIESYPKLLRAIKDAIAPKPLSIAVPAQAKDMIAFTPEQGPAINDAVDRVHVMTYDLMTRRDTETRHHTDVHGSLQAIDRYIAIGIPPEKLLLGFAYYAKYFQTAPGVDCSQDPLGCPIVLAELPDGTDAGTSGAFTFETSYVAPAPVPDGLTLSPNEVCGAGTSFTCLGSPQNNTCCSSSGYCGSTTAHCGVGCQSGYGTCTGPSITDSFQAALADNVLDQANGGAWYWDAGNELFWSLETPALICRKFDEIVAARRLAGVFAWSLGEDTYDWSHVAAVNKNVARLNAGYKWWKTSV